MEVFSGMSYLQKAKEWEAKRKAKQDKPAKVVDFCREAQKRGYAFPYPINETLGIGSFDPMDIRYINGRPVLEPGWWKKIPKKGRWAK